MANRYISAQYDAATITVDYAGSDGTHLLRTGGTIAWRFNNPGNIRPGRGNRIIMGAIGVGRTRNNFAFLIFASYEDGRAQKKSLLRRKYNDRTIHTMLTGIDDGRGGLMLGYAPASDNNNPLAYAQAIAQHIDLPITTVLSTLSDAQMEKMLDAMEKKEGYHNSRESRSERIVPTTGVTISDGARPRPNTPVQVKIGSKTYHHKTDETGQLPRIAHTKRGEKVEIYLPTMEGEWKKQLEFNMNLVSSTYVLFNDLLRFDGNPAPKKAPTAGTSSPRQPFRYPVRGGDTLGKLATRFTTTVSKIRKDNPAIKSSNKIFVGQVIGIYGPPPKLKGPAALTAPTAPLPSAVGGPAPRVASPQLPAQSTTRQSAAQAISNQGSGQPIAIVQAEHLQAPWMMFAIEEAKKFSGKNESIINTTRNYHRELGLANSYTLSNTAWCASFVNFCLKSTNTPHLNNPSSQFPCNSTLFIRIAEPVFGAIMVMRNYLASNNSYAGKGHITLVYGKTSSGAIAGLGGNQGDTLRVSPYKIVGNSASFRTPDGRYWHQRFYAFFIPATYAQFAQQDVPLTLVNTVEVNQQLLNISNAATTVNEGTL
jgi:uncharacterized protein (TIGR02594 family)